MTDTLLLFAIVNVPAFMLLACIVYMYKKFS